MVHVTRLRWSALLVALAFCLVAGSARADTISLVGSLDPDDPSSAFLFTFQLTSPGLEVQSWGYGGGLNGAGTVVPPGGFDGYLSLFLGGGPSATFLESNDDGGCPPAGTVSLYCRDPRLDLPALAPGIYTLALTTFGNMSFAENYWDMSSHSSVYTLGDGFIGLGSYYDWDLGEFRTPAFALDITGDVTVPPAVPEPGTALLVATGLAATWRGLRRRVGR